MIIYAEHGQFLEEEITELKETLDARGGQGLIVIEDGEFLLICGLTNRIGSGFR